jgi:hypothetical protein
MQMIVDFFQTVFAFLGGLFTELIEWIHSLIAQI